MAHVGWARVQGYVIVRDYNSTPRRFRTLLGLIKPHICFLNPGGGSFGGGVL